VAESLHCSFDALKRLARAEGTFQISKSRNKLQSQSQQFKIQLNTGEQARLRSPKSDAPHGTHGMQCRSPQRSEGFAALFTRFPIHASLETRHGLFIFTISEANFHSSRPHTPKSLTLFILSIVNIGKAYNYTRAAQTILHDFNMVEIPHTHKHTHARERLNGSLKINKNVYKQKFRAFFSFSYTFIMKYIFLLLSFVRSFVRDV